MKKSNLLIALALGLCSLGANAQEKSWTSGSEIAPGKYIIYNINTEGYLDGGFDSWGTNGGIYKNPRFFELNSKDEGWEINTYTNNGGNNNYMQASTWLDGAPVTQTLTSVSKNGYSLAYAFGNGGNNFRGVAKNEAIAFDEKTEGNEWLFISEADYKKALENMVYDGSSYINATALIQGARVYRNYTAGICNPKNNNAINPAWSETHSANINLCGGSNQYKAAEFFHGTFDIHQTISGLPDGEYEVGVNAFQRTPDDTKNTYLYANGNEVAIMSLSEGINNTCNDMTAAGKAFFEDDFNNNWVKAIVVNGELTFGIKRESNAGVWTDWAIFNNFSLRYYGENPDSYISTIKEMLPAATELVDKPMNAEVLSALEDAISEADAIIANSEASTKAYKETLATLNTAVKDAETSIAAYEAFVNDAMKYDELAQNLDETGKAAWDEAIAQLNSEYSDGTMVSADVEAVYAAAVKSQKSVGADMTYAIVNANFETDNAGWKNGALGGVSYGGRETNRNVEAWNRTFEIYQEIEGLPEGSYEITFQSSYRLGNAQPAADAEAAGNYVSDAKFYANGVEAGFPSIFRDAALIQHSDNEGYAETSLGWIPHNMAVFSDAFSQGLYTTTINVKVKRDGKLTLGFKKEKGNDPDGNWPIFDNVTLKYLGIQYTKIEQEGTEEVYLVDAGDVEPYVEQPLAKDMYMNWTSGTKEGTIIGAAQPWDCALDFNTSTGLPYGNGNVTWTLAADLTSWDRLVLTSVEGTPRFCLNRTIDGGQAPNGLVDIPGNGDQTAKYCTYTDNPDGTKTTELNIKAIVADYGFARLHCIKGAWWANTNVTSAILSKGTKPSADGVHIPVANDDEVTVGYGQIVSGVKVAWNDAEVINPWNSGIRAEAEIINNNTGYHYFYKATGNADNVITLAQGLFEPNSEYEVNIKSLKYYDYTRFCDQITSDDDDWALLERLYSTEIAEVDTTVAALVNAYMEKNTTATAEDSIAYEAQVRSKLIYRMFNCEPLILWSSNDMTADNPYTFTLITDETVIADKDASKSQLVRILNPFGEEVDTDEPDTNVEDEIVDNEATGINNANTSNTIVDIYSTTGAKAATLQRGLNIVRKADGSVVKIIVK